MGSAFAIVTACRWVSEHNLVINITAHPTTGSLLHLAGLPHPLRELEVFSVDEDLRILTKACSSYEELSHGGYMELQYKGTVHVLIKPPGRSEAGHCIMLHF